MNKSFLSLSIFSASVLALGTSLVMAQTYTPQYNQQPTHNYPAQNINSNFQNFQNFSQQTQPIQNMQPAYNPNVNVGFPALQGRVTIIPPGASMPAVVASEISTENLRAGDSVTLTLNTPFYHNGTMIAPAGSMVSGNAIIAVKAGRAGKHGQLKVRFTNILTPNGQSIPISGKIATQDGSGLLIGGTNKDRAMQAAKNTAVGAGSGALSGVVMGAVSGGSSSRGAAMGTAIGGGLGLGKSIWQKGRDVIISAGTPVDIQFDQPVTVAPMSMQY